MTEEQRSENLQNLLWLINDVDQLIELAMSQHASVAETVPRAIDRLLKYIDASAATVRVTDDDGVVRDFTRPSGVDVMDDQIDDLAKRLRDVNSVWLESDAGMVYGQRLDVSVHYLGAVVAHFDRPHEPWERDHAQKALYHWAEIVDNYIASVTDARVKQQALRQISDGFKGPILENALDEAIAALGAFVDYDSLIVVCQSDEFMEKSSYTYRIVNSDEVEYTSAMQADPRVSALVQDAVERLLRNETVDDVLEELHVTPLHLEDVPIYDLSGQRIVGRVLVGMRTPISGLTADLVDRFADYLRQRVVDFSREWRNLSRMFPKPTVERLLREPNYRERFLTPREEDVAVIYTDIAGFTRLSEQVLSGPTAVGRLIDRWSRHVVEIIWETGGVFDKMVGDCVIGLWGPPFYDADPAERCRSAAEAARRIRDYTAALTTDEEFPEIADSDVRVGVATGLHYCSICVGTFGPNDDFTGFSSGMNNAARLQGVATIDEILCMDDFVTLLGDHAFGDERTAKVKNVAEPIRFRPLH